jgi:hypothetical protein
MNKNVWPYSLMISFYTNIKHIIVNVVYDAINAIISKLDKITPTINDIKQTKCTKSYLRYLCHNIN